MHNRPQSFEQIIQSWDTANKVSELSDFSVCTTWGFAASHFHLLNVFRKKLTYPDLKRAVHEQRVMFGATVILIEDKASGTQLVQDLIDEGVSMVTGCKSEGDKVMRLHAQTATMEGGFVHLPLEAHWLDDYLHEMLVFPKGRHDDQVDSTAQAIAWTKQRQTNTGMIEFYAREAAKQNGEVDGPMVRLRAPHGMTHVYLRSGEAVCVHHSTISVPQSDVGPLLCAGFLYWR